MNIVRETRATWRLWYIMVGAALAAVPAHAASFNPSWTIDATYGHRWMLGAIVASEGRTPVRFGVLVSGSGVLVLGDAIRRNHAGQLYAGLGAVVSTEPATNRGAKRRRSDDDESQAYIVSSVKDRADEAHVGAYAVFGLRGTVPDKPNAMVEVRLMGFDHGGRAAASFGVVF